MLKLVKDYRIGGNVRYYLSDKEINQMQIPDEIIKCVCFIYCPTVSGEKKLLGTGFFIYEQISDEKGFVYCITAKHILEGVKNSNLSIDNSILLRVNLRSGGSTYISTNINDWKYNTDDYLDDIALLQFDPTPDLDINMFPLSEVANEEVIVKEEINVGDEIFIAGLFSKYHDTLNVVPIIRSGIISAMPREKIRIREGLIDAYLIETRSMGGLSGSPVFVNLGPTRFFKDRLYTASTGYKLYLLGVIRAHWEWEEKELDFTIGEEIKRLNMGIAIITPAMKIFKVINHPINYKAKKHYIMELYRGDAPVDDKKRNK